MPTLVYIVLLVSVLFNLIATVRSQRTCYYPDRSIAVNDQPCRPDANSPCCSSGWSCLENGICERTSLADRFNPNVTDYNYGRGSCTDRTWRSSECPLFCIGVGYDDTNGNVMTSCDNNTYCCTGSSCDCATNTNTTSLAGDDFAFTTIDIPGPDSRTISSNSFVSTNSPSSLVNISTTDSATTIASTTSIQSLSQPIQSLSQPTASASASPPPHQRGLSTGSKAGIGVGVAFGVAAIVMMGLLYLRAKRKRLKINNLMAERIPVTPEMTRP